MSEIKEPLLILAILALSALFGASLYESVVLAPNFSFGIPDSLEHFRRFMSTANPGTFFRVVAPMAQILLLASLILNWKNPFGRRKWLLIALLLTISGDVITFVFHYPRNAVLFRDPMKIEPAILEKVAREWSYGNYVRILLVVIALLSVLKAYKASEGFKAA